MNEELKTTIQNQDINLNGLLKHNIDNYLDSNEFGEMVKASVKKLIDASVQDALREYGPIGKKIKEHIEAACIIDNYDLPSISIIDIVLQEVNQSLSSIIHEETINKLNDRVKTHLEIPFKKDESIDFKDILILILKDSKMVDCVCGEHNIEDFLEYHDIHEYITCIIDSTNDKYYNIYLDEYPDKTIKNCSYHIGVNKKNGTLIYYHSISYSNVKDIPVNQYRILNSFYGIASTLYKLELVGAKVNIDSIDEYR